MSIDAVTLTQMRYAVALRETRSFSQAAKTCHVTQSTLSIQIQKLEELLGAQVFDRSTKPLEPTAIGEQVIAIFEGVVQATDRIPLVVEKKISHISGQLKIGIIPTVSPLLTPAIARAFGQGQPPSTATGTARNSKPPATNDLVLSIEEVQTGLLLERLENATVDAAILADSPHAPWMHSSLLFEEEFLIYLGPNHRLLKKSVVSSEDLDPDEAWILKEGHCFGTQAMGLCTAARKGRETARKLRYAAGNFDSLIDLVDAAGGFTLLPWLYCHRQGILGLAQVKRFADPVPVRQVFYIQRKDSVKRSTHEYIKDLVTAALPAELGKEDPHSGARGPRSTKSIPVFAPS
jgi:LysR family hydrogen peroxide-inducible transcriptional activator